VLSAEAGSETCQLSESQVDAMHDGVANDMKFELLQTHKEVTANSGAPEDAVQHLSQSDAETATVVPKEVYTGFKYFRFYPTAARGPGAGRLPIQISEISFYVHTKKVYMASAIATNPDGENDGYEPQNTVDVSPATKWLDHNRKPLILEFPQPKHLDSFSFTTCNDHTEYDPVKWYFDASNDGTNWETLHEQMLVPYATPLARYMNTDAFTVAWRYFKFTPTKVRNITEKADSVEIGEFKLYHGLVEFDMMGARATNPDGMFTKKEVPWRAIDDHVETSWRSTYYGSLYIDLRVPIPVQSFKFWTGAGHMDRDPVQWTFSGSNDGVNYQLLHEQAFNYNVPQKRRSPIKPIKIKRSR